MAATSCEPLPVDDHLSEILARVRERRAVIVTAAPGAGKTTRVPPALVADGRLMLLQPRRVAARAIAQRIAAERRWTVGREVGWHVRFDRRESDQTRLLVATEGILTARLQQDPLLSDFRTVVLDEFHERNIHSDLGLALVRQAWLARDDLRIVVMSATLDAAAVSQFLGDCPVIDVPGRLFPVAVSYRPGEAAEDVVVEELRRAEGAALVFLPGVREIRRAADQLSPRLPGIPVLELHGSLDAEQQDAALSPSDGPRVILATNIAETTLTVPDVRLVVDAGWQKVARYDASRGLDRLETERISQDAADQRAGRAGRVGPGRAVRLWDAHARLRPHRVPEIARIDLVRPALDVMAWGADPRTFEWFEAPSREALDAAIGLLSRLGAIAAGGGLTPLGRRMQRLPLHPRLARLLIAAGGAIEAARAVAVLSERRSTTVPGRTTAAACDVWAAAEGDLASHLRRVAHEVRETARRAADERLVEHIDEQGLRRAVLAGYPDRVARRRAPGSDRVLLATGTGARLGRESGVLNHEFLIAVDVGGAASAGTAAEAVIQMATGIERDWLEPTATVVEHTFDDAAGVVRARRVERYDALILASTDVDVDPEERARLMTHAILERGPDETDRQLLARLAAVGEHVTFESLARIAGAAVQRIGEFRAADFLPHQVRVTLDREAPADLPLPSGRRVKLDYRADGRVVAAVKLQELFGLADTPRVGRARVPVTFELLAPNGRPVQVTSDLRSFWSTGYPEVRKELRGRYPRHPWPEDPWTAEATHRTVKRR